MSSEYYITVCSILYSSSKIVMENYCYCYIWVQYLFFTNPKYFNIICCFGVKIILLTNAFSFIILSSLCFHDILDAKF